MSASAGHSFPAGYMPHAGSPVFGRISLLLIGQIADIIEERHAVVCRITFWYSSQVFGSLLPNTTRHAGWKPEGMFSENMRLRKGDVMH